MDIKQLEEMIEPSAMKMAGENQARLDSLASATGAINNLLKIAQNLDYSKKLTGNIATQDLLSTLSQTFPSNNLFLDNETTKIMKELADSPIFNSSIFESLEVNKSFIDIIEATNLGLKPQTQFISPEGFTSQNQIGDLSSVMSKATEAFKQHKQFEQYSSFKVLSNLNKDFFTEILRINLTPADIEGFSESSIAEIDAELSDEIKLEKDFSSYSEKAKKILYFFCTAILLSYLIGIASSITANYIQQFQEVSKTLETSREVKSFTRSSPPLIDRQALKGHRVTTANNLNFRHKPSMNSNVIEILPIGTIVKVVDKSNRSWLLVEVEIDSEIEQGWVLRRYTTYFK